MKTKFLLLILFCLYTQNGYTQTNERKVLGIWKICRDSMLFKQCSDSAGILSIKAFSSKGTLLNLYWDASTSSYKTEEAHYEVIADDSYIEMKPKDLVESKLSESEKKVWFNFEDDNIMRIIYQQSDRKTICYELWTRVTSFPQDDCSTVMDTIYSTVTQMPEFPGGASAMLTYLRKNLRYPYEPFEKIVSVVVKFVVEKDGSLSHVYIKRGADDLSLDKEALRIVKSMPKWTPGYKDGKPVRVYISIPVLFRW